MSIPSGSVMRVMLVACLMLGGVGCEDSKRHYVAARNKYTAVVSRVASLARFLEPADEGRFAVARAQIAKDWIVEATSAWSAPPAKTYTEKEKEAAQENPYVGMGNKLQAIHQKCSQSGGVLTSEARRFADCSAEVSYLRMRIEAFAQSASSKGLAVDFPADWASWILEKDAQAARDLADAAKIVAPELDALWNDPNAKLEALQAACDARKNADRPKPKPGQEAIAALGADEADTRCLGVTVLRVNEGLSSTGPKAGSPPCSSLPVAFRMTTSWCDKSK